MSINHTQADWNLKSVNDNPEEGWTIYSKRNDTAENFIVCQRSAIKGEEFAANARLIESAPRLYGWLKLICERPDMFAGNEGMQEAVLHLLKYIDTNKREWIK